MRLIFLLMLVFPMSISADSYTLEIKNPQEKIEAIALEGAADKCRNSNNISLEEKLEMTEIASFYQARRQQLDISYNHSLAIQASEEKFGIQNNPSYEICVKALHR